MILKDTRHKGRQYLKMYVFKVSLPTLDRNIILFTNITPNNKLMWENGSCGGGEY